MGEGKTPFYWDATAATDAERAYAEWSSFNEGGGFGFFIHLKEDLGADLSTHQIELDPPIIGQKGKPVGFQLTSPSGVVINTKTETTIKGLYATGEAAYGTYFPSSPWAYATGARAGHNAAEYSLQAGEPAIEETQVEKGRERIYSPLRLKPEEGVVWQDMNWQIGNIVRSYLLRPTPHTLKQGLERVEDLKREQIQADNPHELMRAMETTSLLSVAEMFFRAALSPRAKDEWRIVKLEKGEVQFNTKPLRHKYPID